MFIYHMKRLLFAQSVIDPVGAQTGEERQLVRVMRAGAGEAPEVRSEHVVSPATRTPRGEA